MCPGLELAGAASALRQSHLARNEHSGLSSPPHHLLGAALTASYAHLLASDKRLGDQFIFWCLVLVRCLVPSRIVNGARGII